MAIKTHRLRTLAAFIALFLASNARAFEPKRLFIEDREHRGRNVTLELTKAILKRCPAIVTVTENPQSVDYRLGITPGASTLYKSDGDVEHIFKARFTVSGLAKEVCGYLERP